MTPRLPRITARDILKVLAKAGFVKVRSSGSHHIYRNAKGKRVTIPVHSSTILHPKTLKQILKDAEITIDDLIKMMND